MSDTDQPIAVYGASGYTGRLVVAELVKRGHSVIAVGRDEGRLARVADGVDGDVAVAPASLGDHAALRGVFGRARAVVNAAGPFSSTCRPVLEAAVAADAHYLDVCGEQEPIRWAFEAGGAAGSRAGVAVAPATAFYSTLVDLTSSLLAEGLDAIDEVLVGYHITDWRPSGAALENRFEGMLREFWTYDDGVRTVRDKRTGFMRFPGAGRQRVAPYPAPDVLSVPRHLPARRVRAFATTATAVDERLGRIMPQTTRLAAALLRTPARPLVEAALAASWGSQRDGRENVDPTRFEIVVQIAAGDEVRRGWVSGRGIFDITGPIVAEAAHRIVDPSFAETGPVVAGTLDPPSFLEALEPHGLRYDVGAGTPAAAAKLP